MENKLKNLRNSMDRTVLKDGILTSEDRLRIILNTKYNKKKSRKTVIAPFLTYAATFSFFIVMSYYAYGQIFPAEEQEQKNATVQQDQEIVYISEEDFAEKIREYVTLKGYTPSFESHLIKIEVVRQNNDIIVNLRTNLTNEDQQLISDMQLAVLIELNDPNSLSKYGADKVIVYNEKGEMLSQADTFKKSVEMTKEKN